MKAYILKLLERVHRAITGPYVEELDGPADIEQFFKEIIIGRGRKRRAKSYD